MMAESCPHGRGGMETLSQPATKLFRCTHAGAGGVGSFVYNCRQSAHVAPTGAGGSGTHAAAPRSHRSEHKKTAGSLCTLGKCAHNAICQESRQESAPIRG